MTRGSVNRKVTTRSSVRHLIHLRTRKVRWVTPAPSITRVRSRSIGPLPRWSNNETPPPSRTGTRSMWISSRSPARRHCCTMLAAPTPTPLSPATACACARAHSRPSVTNLNDLGVLPLGAGPVPGGGLRAPQHDHVLVVAHDVVDLRRRLGRLALAAEVLQHLGLALIGPGPLAVAAHMPDHIVRQELIHSGHVAPLKGREAFPDEGDVGMLVMGHGDSFSQAAPWPGRRGVYLGLLPTRIR